MQLRAFTIIELIMVVTLIGIMAVFAIPQYTKSIDRANRKDGTVNLTAIYAAEQIYHNNNGTYWPLLGSETVSAINSNLGLGILSNNLTYTCQGRFGTRFDCTAVRGNPIAWTLAVSQNSPTPTCTDGVSICP